MEKQGIIKKRTFEKQLIKITLQQHQYRLVFFPSFETILCDKMGWMGDYLSNTSECNRSSHQRCAIKKKVFLKIS